MTERNEAGNTYAQSWSVENYLDKVDNTTDGLSESYVRDANNKLLRKTTTDASGFKDLTVYLGAVELHYTAASPNASVTSYYLFGGQRVAMNKNGTLTYLHGDHLGSASIATDGSGTVLNEGAFKPFGEPLGSSTFANDKTYTGQRVDSATGGLMDYNARFYSPILGRFVSADSIVPGAGNPQALNRYAYTINNPLKYKDPSGHCYGEATAHNDNLAGCPGTPSEKEMKQASRLIVMGSASMLICMAGGCAMIIAGAIPDTVGQVGNRLQATNDLRWTLVDIFGNLDAGAIDGILASGLSNVAQGAVTKKVTSIGINDSLVNRLDGAMWGVLAGIGASCALSDCVSFEGVLSAEIGNITSSSTGFALDRNLMRGVMKSLKINNEFRGDLFSNTLARIATGLICIRQYLI